MSQLFAGVIGQQQEHKVIVDVNNEHQEFIAAHSHVMQQITYENGKPVENLVWIPNELENDDEVSETEKTDS